MAVKVYVEFFGSVRFRAGVAQTVVSFESERVSVREILCEVGTRYPQLVEFCCGADGSLKSGFILNMDGREFTTDVTREVSRSQSLLFLSADVGG